MRRWLLGSLLIGAALIVPSTVAGAQQYPICTITPSLTAERVADGIRVQGSGFTAPFEDIELTIDGGSATQLVGPTFTAVIPVQLSGNVAVRAVATAAGTDTTCQATAEVGPTTTTTTTTTTTRPPSNGLPPTGSDTSMVWVGLAAIGVGTLLAVAARRRRSVRQMHHAHGRAYHSSAPPAGATGPFTAAEFVQYTPLPRQSVPEVTPVPELSPPTPLPSRTLVAAGVVANGAEEPTPSVHEAGPPVTWMQGTTPPPAGVTLLTTEVELPSADPAEVHAEPVVIEAPVPAAPVASPPPASDFETSLQVVRATFAEWAAEAESAHPG